MMRLFLYLLICTPLTLLAQYDANPLLVDFQTVGEYKKAKKAYAEHNIRNLKQGALIISLKTRQKAIDNFRKAGQEHYARDIEHDQQIHNQVIIQEFALHYDFCKVYVIKNTDMDRLLSGDRKNIFLDKYLKVDDSIEMTEDFFMIAEFSTLTPETARIINPNTNKPEVLTIEANGTQERAVLIKDQFNQRVWSPFPNQVKAQGIKFTTRQVRKLNQLFHSYYSENK